MLNLARAEAVQAAYLQQRTGLEARLVDRPAPPRASHAPTRRLVIASDGTLAGTLVTDDEGNPIGGIQKIEFTLDADDGRHATARLTLRGVAIRASGEGRVLLEQFCPQCGDTHPCPFDGDARTRGH